MPERYRYLVYIFVRIITGVKIHNCTSDGNFDYVGLRSSTDRETQRNRIEPGITNASDCRMLLGVVMPARRLS